MNNTPEWLDNILKEIVAYKSYPETKWEELPPQIQYATKAEKAKQRLLDLLCNTANIF